MSGADTVTSGGSVTEDKTGSIWLQGRAPKSIPRAVEEAGTFLASVKKADRSSLSVSALSKLKIKTEESIEHKFDLMERTSIKDMDSLTEVYKISIRIEECSQSLRGFDMSGIFKIPSDF